MAKANNSNVFKIEDGIPIPGRGRRSGFSEVVRQLAVGQSVLVGGPQRNIAAQAASVALRAMDGRKYLTRKAEGGIRVWRTQ